MSKIYEQIKIFIEKEKHNSFCLIKFNILLWKPYIECENLDTLKFIRKSIKECKKIEPELDEDDINLSQIIHDVGFMYIQKEMLVGQKLLLFLGEDEAFYVQKQINNCIKKNIDLQNQINDQAIEINNLKSENKDLKDEVRSLKSELNSLKEDHSDLNSKVNSIDIKVYGLDADISSLRRQVINL